MGSAAGRDGTASPAKREPAGCLPVLGLAVGTWLAAAFVLMLLAMFVFPGLYFSRVGEVMGTLLLPHLIGFGVARLWWIRRGASLLRIGAVVVAVEVAIALLVLLLTGSAA